MSAILSGQQEQAESLKNSVLLNSQRIKNMLLVPRSQLSHATEPNKDYWGAQPSAWHPELYLVLHLGLGS